MFKSDDDRALAYAAYKSLEKLLLDDGDLPPGYSRDFSGSSVNIVLSKGSVVERSAGEHGNGTVMKRAVQNLYGYALWALLINRLRKFRQWNKIRVEIIDCMRQVISRSGNNMRQEIVKEFPEVVDEMAQIQSEITIPCRIEETPRRFRCTLPATVRLQIK